MKSHEVTQELRNGNRLKQHLDIIIGNWANKNEGNIAIAEVTIPSISSLNIPYFYAHSKINFDTDPSTIPVSQTIDNMPKPVLCKQILGRFPLAHRLTPNLKFYMPSNFYKKTT